jgi:endogenous inhibitor of DNA gyrase (YacG/DUF329 family)
MYNKEIHLADGLMAGNYHYFNDAQHPLAQSNGAVYYHRHVASIKLGRWLNSDEHVHHKDGNKLNNVPENLEVLSNSEHAKLHKAHGPDELLECPLCGKLFTVKFSHREYRVFCSIECSKAASIKNPEITKEFLEELMPKYSWRELGSLFSYSDVGIKKRAKALGCDMTLAKYRYKHR